MAVSLAVFPPEILNLILGFKGMSSVVSLWLTGNSRIQRSMTTGLTRVELVNTRRFVVCRIPKFLQSLRALRELTVDRGLHAIFFMQESQQVVRNLNPTLRELRLLISNAVELILPATIPNAPNAASLPANVNDDDSSSSNWSIETAFPLLEVLELNDYDQLSLTGLPRLPSNLTDLAMPLPGDYSEIASYVSALPRTLKRLASRGCTNLIRDCLPLLPPHLTQLLCQWDPNDIHDVAGLAIEKLQLLPRSLTDTNLTSSRIPSPSVLAAYPPSLTSLQLHGLRDDDEEDYVNIGRIFPNLTEFVAIEYNIYITPEILRAMPQSLTYLKANVDLSVVEQGDWPKSVIRLSISTSASQRFEVLPHSLKRLHIEGTSITEWSAIPAGITHLSGNCRELNPLEFALPLAIKALELRSSNEQWTVLRETAMNGKRMLPIMPDNQWSVALPPLVTIAKCFSFEKLPASLTSLVLGCCLPASKLKFLPRRLQLLSVRLILLDVDFQPNDPADQEALREIWHIGHFEGRLRTFSDSQDFIPPELCNGQASMASLAIAMLPRTLQNLYFHATHLGDETHTDWFKYLPPSTHFLNILGPLHSDFVFEAPLASVKELSIVMSAPTLAHLKKLRQFGGIVCLAQKDFDKYIDAMTIAKHWPSDSVDTTLVRDVDQALIQVTEENRRLLDAKDADGLRKLLSVE